MLMRILIIITSILILNLIIFSHVGCAQEKASKFYKLAVPVNFAEEESQKKEPVKARLSHKGKIKWDIDGEREKNKPKAEHQIDLDLPENYLACEQDWQCYVVNNSCCHGESHIAINRNFILAVKRMIMGECKNIKFEFKKEGKSFCKRRGMSMHKLNPGIMCELGQCKLVP